LLSGCRRQSCRAFFLYSYVFVSDAPTRLAWVAPTEAENGDRLNDLAGYDIHCWNAAMHYMTTIHVEKPSATSYVIDDLAPGTYQCAVAAIDASGHESALSNVVAKTIP
jgi:hypothetical protein